MIKSATYTSIWDGGHAITTDCKVNMDTKEVFDIEPIDVDVDILENEYVTIDGKQYPVARKDEIENNNGYWYE